MNEGFSVVDLRSDLTPNSVLCDPSVSPLPFEYVLGKEEVRKGSRPGSFVSVLEVRVL